LSHLWGPLYISSSLIPSKNKSSKELIPLKLFHQIDMSYSNWKFRITESSQEIAE